MPRRRLLARGPPRGDSPSPPTGRVPPLGRRPQHRADRAATTVSAAEPRDIGDYERMSPEWPMPGALAAILLPRDRPPLSLRPGGQRHAAAWVRERSDGPGPRGTLRRPVRLLGLLALGPSREPLVDLDLAAARLCRGSARSRAGSLWPLNSLLLALRRQPGGHRAGGPS